MLSQNCRLRSTLCSSTGSAAANTCERATVFSVDSLSSKPVSKPLVKNSRRCSPAPAS